MMRYGGYGYGYGMMGYGFRFLIMLAVVVLIALCIAVLVRHIMRTRRSDRPVPVSPGNGAINILNERYAKGEISEEEYKKKKTDILG